MFILIKYLLKHSRVNMHVMTYQFSFLFISCLVFEHSALEWSLILFSFLISHIMEDKVITPACENFDSVEKKSEFREVVEVVQF